ncbi:succinate dehydrogenase, hydrophobic membrane anchor protein [Enterovirga rhinocerotis]|uniref:Succinate dehydrogenase hydrophobic membrane anchor subunit n=1 Tax=Enterovirga rhinocerotis TaxID=1339210 RepID=A0A4R7BJC0_9HYPH|nr:succinate dehydrogenase, hydrophobic membrane anchor protein [Enterovirga rhinocerotis]TDR85434.1 succinate dehydrogenase / fumarate reductase membrane anchor subunit [Enterovirga rhinocerotis]
MADTKPRSIRTDRSRVRGLGAAHHGVEHWWAARVTAIANILLGFCFIIIMASAAGRPWPEAVLIVSHPVVAVLLALLVVSVTYHMRLGLQVVIEDYVHDEGLKLAANLANTFFAVLIAGICLFAIVKVSLLRALPL